MLKYNIIPSEALNQGTVGLSPRLARRDLRQLSSRLVISFINPFLATTGASQFVTGSSPAAVITSWSVSPIISPEEGAGEILGVTCGHHDNGLLFMIGGNMEDEYLLPLTLISH